MSTEAHPMQVVNTAHSKNMRADEIAIETAKIGEVTAVVTVMSIFCRKRCKSQVLFLKMRSLLVKRQKAPIFLGETPANQEFFLRKQEKVGF